MKQLLAKEFIRFCLVGALGFVINLVLLTLLYKVFRAPLFIAQLVAAEIALFNNFLFHHRWTYKSHHVVKSLKRLIVQFHATSWVAIVGSALLVSAGVHLLHMSYPIALIISSAVGLFWNFGWSKFVIWRHHKAADDEPSHGLL